LIAWTVNANSSREENKLLVSP